MTGSDGSTSGEHGSNDPESTPSGLTSLAGLTVLSAFVTGVGGIVTLFGAAGGSADGIFGLLGIGAGVGLSYLAYGLWTVRPWAWRWSLAVYGVLTFGNLLAGNILTVFLFVAVLVYLLYVRYTFRRSRHSRFR